MNEETMNDSTYLFPNEVENDICTIKECSCKYRTGINLCSHEGTCAFSLSSKWLSSHKPNEKSTIEKILEQEKKLNRPLMPIELEAIIPESEIERETNAFAIDFKGNIFSIKRNRVIGRNWRK